ncbi:hypothetical protein APR41_17255 [Salegentibacter salinarum]|uniref:Uncharacterized protein n=1 Tax=Salegentibacter salinarum TaxID=447422 RepID=A0A2N0TW66_9FLAO|nr:hypothetical protein APR41_17255 [Salegentibacter salinarum]SKB96196.1 hypothetical protein SAMN05660903_03501 [Salegentibacter salinarum]
MAVFNELKLYEDFNTKKAITSVSYRFAQFFRSTLYIIYEEKEAIVLYLAGNLTIFALPC